MGEQKMVSFRMDNDDRATLAYYTLQLQARVNPKISRSDVFRLAIGMLQELGIDKLVEVLNGASLDFSVIQRRNG